MCIDTGLHLTFNCVPQALLSRSHLVLYTETLRMVHLVTYDLQLLRSVLMDLGFAQDDPNLKWPLKVAPSNTRTLAFETVASTCKHARVQPCPQCLVELAVQADVELSNNRDPYPIIIPKWTAFREDLKRHRIRSVMTLSKRSGTNDEVPLDDIENAAPTPAVDNANTNHHHFVVGLNGANPQANGNINPEEEAHGIHDHVIEEPHVHLEMIPYPHAALHFPDVFPRELATITHHYFDYSSLGAEQLPIKRTVMAETFLRRPRVLVLPWPPCPMQDPEWIGEGIYLDQTDDATYDTDDETDEVDSLVGGTDALNDLSSAEDLLTNENAHTGYEPLLNGQQLEANSDIRYSNEPTLGDDALHISLNGDTSAGFLAQEDSSEATGVHYDEVYNETEHQALQLSLDGTDPVVSTDQIEAFETPTQNGNSLQNSLHNLMATHPVFTTMARTLASIGADPFGGCPVMGYGGRCAVWVEERLNHDQRYEVRPVLRLATFPAYERPMGKYNDVNQDVTIYPELEKGSGHVATLHVSDQISLENAYSFDLDDISGRVGITTSLGELWIVQCVSGE